MADHVEQQTTGHEWDGITELDTPIPRWWKNIIYLSIVWAIGYWIAMPAWPLLTEHTKGVLGYSSRGALLADINSAQAAKKVFFDRIADASLADIRADPELLKFALAGGRSAYSVNCSQCHGSGAAGGKGYPNLNDDEWVWGGTLEALQFTITHGVRNESDDARTSDMPAFLKDEVLTAKQVNDVTEFVLSLNNRATDKTAAERGRGIYTEHCVACHKADASGNAELGAPALNNEIWLYGGDRASIRESIARSRKGVMPAWGALLDAPTIKQLAVYIHSLGGGQ